MYDMILVGLGVVTGQPPANSRIRHQPGDRDDILSTAAAENRAASATDGASCAPIRSTRG